MATPSVREVTANGRTVWRVARTDALLRGSKADQGTLGSSSAGNRFDSEDFGVVYFGSDLRACYGETLSRFRPDLKLLAAVPALRNELRGLGGMEVGAVPAEWRSRRSVIRVRLPDHLPYLDVEDLSTLQFLRSELALGLSALGCQDLDLSVTRGPDRRVTRLISNWAWLQQGSNGPRFAGIRYCSRMCDEWECWAVFDDSDLEFDVVVTQPIEVDDPALRHIAGKYELIVH